MADAVLRREIKRLVEEQKVLNQRLQRKPPGSQGPRPTGEGAGKENAGASLSGDAAAAGEKRQQVSTVVQILRKGLALPASPNL